MIQIDSLQKDYPDKTLFKNLSVKFIDSMRVGLVGPNGAGKSTLLKIILGICEFDHGKVNISSTTSLGYLPQEIIVGNKNSILEEVLSTFPEVSQLQIQIKKLNDEISLQPNNAQLLESLDKIQNKFDALNGWNIEDNAKKILSGLGFSTSEFIKPFDTFSGGWRMRVVLAGILLKRPNYLLLDEPTNHLDLDAIIWLENFLMKWNGGLIMISHDRSFLNQSVNYILELENGTPTLYKGNYTDFIDEKELRQEQLHNAFKNQQKKIKDTERFIERFRYKNTKAKQVQSRVKQLEKLDIISEPAILKRKISLHIPQPSRGPLKVVELINVSKLYGDKTVYNDINFTIERGEKIALVGPNGAGKSTLMKLIAKSELSSRGRVKIGDGVNLQYFTQHQLESLNENDTIYHTIFSISGGWTETQIRSYLGSFLFEGEAITKKVKVLSGGEKSRLALAKMLVEPSHILLLDEPTNHLDIQSRDIIESALQKYSGTLVCISHDRHFLNTITNKVIHVENGQLKPYEGNYDYYIWKKEKATSEVNELQNKKSKQNNKQDDFKSRKVKRNRYQKVVKRIGEIENTLNEISTEINNPENSSDFEKLQSLQIQQQELEDEYFKLIYEQESLEA